MGLSKSVPILLLMPTAKPDVPFTVAPISSSTFVSSTEASAGLLLDRLSEAHTREVSRLYTELDKVRNQLENAGNILNDYLEREKQLTKVMEEIGATVKGTSGFAAGMSQSIGTDFDKHHGDHDKLTKNLGDPRKDAMKALQDIRHLLEVPQPEPPALPHYAQYPPSGGGGGDYLYNALVKK